MDGWEFVVDAIMLALPEQGDLFWFVKIQYLQAQHQILIAFLRSG
jgi:hypothetical protein